MSAFILRSIRLFRLISWYYLRRHALRTILLLSVLTVGVAAMFAGAASLPVGERAVAAAYDLTAGRGRIVVYPGTVPAAAVTETDLQTVRRTAGVETAAPLIRSGGLVLAQNELLVFWGIDPAVEREVRDYRLAQGGFIDGPGQAMFSEAYAGEKGFSVGQQISLAGPGGVYSFTLVGTLADTGIASLNGGDLAVLEYTDALTLAGTDSFSSIAVVPEDGQDAAGLIVRLQSALSNAVSVGRPASYRKSPTDFISQALQFNSGLIVMVLGALMITGTLAASIAQRRSEIGVLRALGLTRTDIRNLFLGESGALGIIGSLAGILLGDQIKSVMPPWMPAGSLSAPVDSTVPVWITLLIFFLSVGIVLLASLLPARQAARLDPIDAILRPRIDADGARFGRLSIVIGLSLLIGLSVLRLLLDNSKNAVILPLVAELAVLAGGALLLPPLIAALSRRIPPLMNRLFGAGGLLAAESLAKRPRRMVITAIIVFGTVWTFSTGIGVDRSTSAFLDRWLDYERAWDVTVSGPGEDANHPIAGIPSKIAGEIAARPDVATAVRERFAILSYQNRDYCLWALDIESFVSQRGSLKLSSIRFIIAGNYRRAST